MCSSERDRQTSRASSVSVRLGGERERLMTEGRNEREDRGKGLTARQSVAEGEENERKMN